MTMYIYMEIGESWTRNEMSRTYEISEFEFDSNPMTILHPDT